MNSYSGVVISCLENLNNVRYVPPSDVARSLGRIVRFAGHTERPISVLTHSFSVAKEVQTIIDKSTNKKLLKHRNDVIVAALIHDATEAFISDIPVPFKTASQRELEDKIFFLINKGWNIKNIPSWGKALIKDADNNAASCEARNYGVKNYHMTGLKFLPPDEAFSSVYWANSVCPFERGFYVKRMWEIFEEIVQSGNTKTSLDSLNELSDTKELMDSLI